jgi:hypothetical protein
MIYGLMSSFIKPTRIGMKNKTLIEYRIENSVNCVVDDSIANASFVNMTDFGVSDKK